MKSHIYDLDGTLYPNAEAHFKNCDETAILVLQRNFKILLPPHEIKTLFMQAMDHGKHWASPFADRYNIPLIEIHHAYNNNLPVDHVTPHQDLPSLLDRMKDDKHCILTHSSRPFTIRTLEKIGLRSHFDDARILGYEHYIQMKSHGATGIRKALSVLQEDPSKDTFFYEDTAANLSAAKRELGITTIFIGARDAIPSELARDIDYVAPDICAHLRQFLK